MIHPRARAYLLSAATLFLTPSASAECIYTATFRVQQSLVALDLQEHSEVFSIDGAGGSLSRGLLVRGETAYVNYLGFVDPDPRYLLLPGRVFHVDLIRKQVLGEIQVGRGNLDMTGARNKLYTANSLEDSVTIVDLATFQTTNLILGELADFPTSAAATPDGSRVFVGDSGTGYVFVIDTESDELLLAFDTMHGIQQIVATDDHVYIAGSSLAGGTELLAFEREGDGYAHRWTADIGFSFGLAIAGREMFSVSRSGLMRSVSLDEPREVMSYVFPVGDGNNLLDVTAHADHLYIAGEGGLFRFDPLDRSHELVTGRRTRGVDVAPCPRSFPGDADCDRLLSAGDLDAAVTASYDRLAHARCDADCNEDGHVGAADIVCTLLAVSEATDQGAEQSRSGTLRAP